MHVIHSLLQQLTNNPSAQAFLGPENSEVHMTVTYVNTVYFM